MSEHHTLISPKASQARTKEAIRVTLIGALINLLLAIGKFVAGVMGSSAAMIADAVHSLSDLITDAIVYLSTMIASKEADDDHPYGHGRAETIGGAVLGVALMLAGFFIVMEVVEKLMAGNLGAPTWPALIGAIVSIISKEALYRYTAKVGTRINNGAIIANAWHHRTDAFSSIAALAGIGGAMMGFPLLDPLAAILVVFLVVKVGWEIARNAVGDLMDATLPEERLKEIHEALVSTGGARQYHDLRARKLGADVFVDVHLLVQPNISVSEAHNIAETARFNLKEKANVADALVHIDVEEDMDYELMLIDREKVEEKIKCETRKIEGLNNISDVIIHYLRKKVCVEFNVDIDDDVTIAEAKRKIALLRENLLKEEKIDMAVIRGRLTEGLLESEFMEDEKKRGKQ